MKDWKGNKVQKGDIIVVVSTKPMYSEWGIFVPQGKEHKISDSEAHKIIESNKIDDEQYWEPIGEYIVSHVSPNILTDPVKHDGRTFHYASGMIEFWMQPGQIICIKGKSDNKEEYYKSND